MYEYSIDMHLQRSLWYLSDILEYYVDVLFQPDGIILFIALVFASFTKLSILKSTIVSFHWQKVYLKLIKSNFVICFCFFLDFNRVNNFFYFYHKISKTFSNISETVHFHTHNMLTILLLSKKMF